MVEDESIDEPDDDDEDIPDAIELEIEDVLDLHTFLPRDVADVVREYLDQACARGFPGVCIIHGRGAGVQRDIVRSVLERDPRVLHYTDAPPEAGGHGATLVRLE